MGVLGRLRKTTWHSLRKAYVTNLVKSGLDLKTVMELARHSTLQLTMEVYADVDRQSMRLGAEAAAQRVADAISAAGCCTDVARKVVGADAVAVSACRDRRLQQVIMVGATGFESTGQERQNGSSDGINPGISGTSVNADGHTRNQTNTENDTINPAPCCTGVAQKSPVLASLTDIYHAVETCVEIPDVLKPGLLALLNSAKPAPSVKTPV